MVVLVHGLVRPMATRVPPTCDGQRDPRTQPSVVSRPGFHVRDPGGPERGTGDGQAARGSESKLLIGPLPPLQL